MSLDSERYEGHAGMNHVQGISGWSECPED